MVGSKEQCFIVHRDMVCNRSKFFRVACSARWKEGQEKIVRLPKLRPSVFDMYMDWTYFGEIASNVTGSVTGGLISLYVLGDMLDDRDLRNKVMEALQVKFHKKRASPSPGHLLWAWKNTTEGSMLRKWAMDVVILRSRKHFAKHASEYPPEFVQQIAVKLVQQTTRISATDFLAKTQEYQEVVDGA